MSKHLGNVVDPWIFLTGRAPMPQGGIFTQPISRGFRPFSLMMLSMTASKFIGTYWNTYTFYVMYADIDGLTDQVYTPDTGRLCAMDRWILSRLNTVIKTVTAKMDAYDISASARIIQDFTDELSNWYVRRLP